MFRFLLLSSLIFNLTSALAVITDSETGSGSPECASTVAGLAVAGKGLDKNTKGYGDIDYWIHHFVVRRNASMAMAAAMRVAAKDLGELGAEFVELAEDIENAPQTGNGTLDYWTEMCAQQQRVLSRVALKIARLATKSGSEAADVSLEPRAFVKSLRIAMALATENSNGHGNIDYWIHHFEIRRDIANEVATGIEYYLPKIDDRMARLAIKNVSDILRMAPQHGNGTVDYWSAKSSEQQEVFVQAARALREVEDNL